MAYTLKGNQIHHYVHLREYNSVFNNHIRNCINEVCSHVSSPNLLDPASDIYIYKIFKIVLPEIEPTIFWPPGLHATGNEFCVAVLSIQLAELLYLTLRMGLLHLIRQLPNGGSQFDLRLSTVFTFPHASPHRIMQCNTHRNHIQSQ